MESSSTGEKDRRNQHHHKSKRKRCLVCRRKIPRGEGLRYMDFFFCPSIASDDYGTTTPGCFQCFTCQEGLDGSCLDNGGGGLQIISNARGSFVQCGKCALGLNTMGRLIAPPTIPPQQTTETVDETTDVLYDEGDETESGGLRLSINIGDVSDDNSNGSDYASFDGEPDRRAGLHHATKRLAVKALVKLSLANDIDDKKKHLSKLYFTQNQDDRHRSNKDNSEYTTKVAYELDSDAFGNPNYDGYHCSINNFDDTDSHHDTPRTTAVALPQIDSDDVDGTISKKLNVEFCWLDEDGESFSSSTSNYSGYIHPERLGPAMLSIEQFKSETITTETVMKVLRQTWKHYDEVTNITYEITCVVPFKKIYISWEIDAGDELDLTQCQLEVQVRRDPLEEQVEETVGETVSSELVPGRSDAAVCIRMATSTVNNEHTVHKNYDDNDVHDDDNSLDAHSMPNAVYVKTMSTDTASSSGLCPSSIILSNVKEALDPDRDENDNLSELLSVASCINSVIALPSITYLKINKKSYDEEVGLSLIEKNGATVVAEISKSGLFAKSCITEGCEILAINGQCVRGPRSVMRIMKDLVGKVVIMMSASPSPPGCRFVVKKCKETNVGFRSIMSTDEDAKDITLETVNDLVRVQAVAADGLFVGSFISKGDICLSVDGVPAVSDDVATRALARVQSIVVMLMFSLPEFWKSLVEFIIDEKYNRWWKKDSECTLLWGNEDCTPITLIFDEETGLCKADGNEENEINLKYMNIIIVRVMKLLTGSIKAYQSSKKGSIRGSGRSLSVSASGDIMNRSDVYRRALIKLDQMRENGALSANDYKAGKNALAQVAIHTVSEI